MNKDNQIITITRETKYSIDYSDMAKPLEITESQALELRDALIAALVDTNK